MVSTSSDAGTLADFEVLLRDDRVERLWYRLRLELKLPDDVEFASYIQPSRLIPRRDGLLVRLPDYAVFIVTSPNPHPRHKNEAIKSQAVTRLENWREKEDDAWRYAGAGDPAYPIFKALCRDHMRVRQNYKELK